MSNRAKLMISVLFIAAIILTIGLTRFYFDVTKNNVKIDSDDKVESIVRNFGDMQVFRNVNGYCGLLNAEGAVVIEPEWLEILDVTPNLVLVSRRIGDVVLIGGIDYEENIILPFVYRSVEKLGDRYSAAVVDADSTCIVYDAEYHMVFSSSYQAAAYEKGTLSLTSDNGIFYYDVTGEKPALRKAELDCPVGSKTLTWRVGNQVYLAELTESDLSRINQSVAMYLDMLLTDDFTRLGEISSSDFISGLTKPGSMPFAKIDDVKGFSLSKQDADSYDFAFSADYHIAGEDTASQSVQMHLLLRRNADNHLILTSANLNFQGADQSVTETDAA